MAEEGKSFDEIMVFGKQVAKGLGYNHIIYFDFVLHPHIGNHRKLSLFCTCIH